MEIARMREELDGQGYALLPSLLDAEQCRALIAGYDQDSLYRSTVTMARHGFGSGEYRYFNYPLPDPVGRLRQMFYPGLAEIANGWCRALGDRARFPERLDDYLRECRQAGQGKPTPLILKYGAGDYNCLHQDLYGEMHFPLQAAVLLSKPGRDFTGGEFILTEQRPRMQSRAEVVSLELGDAIVFPVNRRPRKGNRGYYRTTMRHGVSRLRTGRRYTLGVIFHDAR